jgi:hypothetical protein
MYIKPIEIVDKRSDFFEPVQVLFKKPESLYEKLSKNDFQILL